MQLELRSWWTERGFDDDDDDVIILMMMMILCGTIVIMSTRTLRIPTDDG